MKIKSTLDSYPEKDSVVTIGTFDGVHIGHQKIIKRLVRIAEEKQLEAVVLTFFPHPRMVLQKDTSIKLINDIEEKSKLLEKFGVDHLVIKKFTQEFSRLTALEFVRDILVKQLHVKHIIIGYDHRFGRNRTADISDLREFGEIYGFDITEISAQDIDEVTVSSTKIRKALKEGNIRTANAYLGYDFILSGRVISGKSLGKRIGFPTANLEINAIYKLIPKTGSYIVRSMINDNEVFGMMNIGTNPTVDGEHQSVEIHFFDFDEDLYDKCIEVELLERLRDEQKFESIEALKEQLNIDKATSLNYIKHHYA